MELDDWTLALRRGQGRALQSAANLPLASVRPPLLDACLHSLAWDAQLESRSRWMVELLQASDDVAWYVPQLLPGLAQARDNWDAEQVLEIAARIARAGHAQLRPAVRGAFLSIHEAGLHEPATGRRALLLMDGEDALLPIARAAGERLLADEGAWEDESFFAEVDEIMGPAAARSRLREVAAREPAIARLLAEIEQASRRREPASSPPSTATDIEDVLSRTDDFWDVGCAAAGRAMTPETAAQLLGRLDSETDPGRLARLLLILATAPQRRASERVLALASGSASDVQAAALGLLRRSRDSRGPTVARELLRADPTSVRRGAAAVLGPACGPSDAELVLAALHHEPPAHRDADAIQRLVGDLLDLRGAPAGRSLVPVFDWIYEHCFCGHCRARAVEALIGLSALNATQREECAFDASDDVRAAAG